MIQVALRIPHSYVSRARYALETLALAWGLPVSVEPDGDQGHLVYASRSDVPAHLRDRTVFVPFDPAVYDAATACSVTRIDGRPAWGPDGREAATLDLVGGTYRLLALLDETQVEPSERDRRGVFACTALPRARGAAAGVPLVEHHAEILFEQLVHAHPAFRELQLPRWPQGKQWAAVMTHDTDATRIGSAGEIAVNVAKAIRSRDSLSWTMVRLGLQHRRGDIRNDPLFGFPAWREWEEARGVKSAFYLFALPPGKRRDLHDCRSSVLDSGMHWDSLRAMAGEGWEFGLHAPIGAKDDPSVFGLTKRLLEERLQAPINGLRHHYWALDWHAPWRTHREHVRAGFQYDASIAWRDRPGFRAGTALPFQPFDPEQATSLPLEVLPTGMMDDQVISGSSAGSSLDAASPLIDAVRAVGGVLVFDWHTEAANNGLRTPGYMDRLTEIYQNVTRDSSCWRPTPSELVTHWRDRRGRLLSRQHPSIAIPTAAGVQ